MLNGIQIYNLTFPYAVLSMNFDVRNVLSHLEIADISEHNGQMPKMKRPTIIYINN